MQGASTSCERRVPRIEQELLTLPEHMSSPPLFSEFHIPRSLVFCVECKSLFVLFFGRCIFYPSDYPFGIFSSTIRSIGRTKINATHLACKC